MSNSKELNNALIKYDEILNAYSEYNKFYNGNTSELLAQPDELRALQLKYPNFFTIKDSIPFKENKYKYYGTTKIELELPILTDIAWKATVSTNISTDLDFECMYNLESVYNLQRKIQIEINKAADALQRGTIDELLSILRFLNQLGPQLKSDYSETKKSINNCS